MPVVPQLYMHFANCAACRDTLATYTQSYSTRIPAFVRSADLSACSVDLNSVAAFIDTEQRWGTRYAIQHDVLTWSHLLQCADCALVYAANTHRFVPLQSIAPLYVPAAMLKGTYVFLNSSKRRSTNSVPPQVVADYHSDGMRMTAALVRENAARWSIQVQLNPAPSGQVRLAWGDYEFTAPIDETGTAVVAHITDAVIAQLVATDLSISVEQALLS